MLSILSSKIISMTWKIQTPVGDELYTLVGLDWSVGVSLVIAIGVVLMQQRRSQNIRDADKILDTDSNDNNYISISRNETDV